MVSGTNNEFCLICEGKWEGSWDSDVEGREGETEVGKESQVCIDTSSSSKAWTGSRVSIVTISICSYPSWAQQDKNMDRTEHTIRMQRGA